MTGVKRILKLQKCLDCPAQIGGIGGKVRCIPCAEKHANILQRARAKKRYDKKRGITNG